MTLIGYHCSHEQHPPSDLLRYVQHAERAGFHAAMCSDHFAPGACTRVTAASPGAGSVQHCRRHG